MAELQVGADRQYRTLAAANAAARTGDTVVVAPGVYRERLQLTTPGVTWRSETPGAAVIDGGWSGRDYDDEFSIQVGIGAANVTLDGFTIRNCEGRAFVAGAGAKGSIISNLRIDNCGTSAFVLHEAEGVTVRGVMATRLGMAWEAGRRPSVAGSVILVRATDCLVENCTVAYGHGEGIDIGRGSRRCTVRGCTIFDNSHLALYFNRCVDCLAEGNLLALTGFAPRNVGDGGWPAGVVFGDEGSENMQTNPHSAGNVFRGNVVVNCGTLLHVRNNAHNYDTQLDASTRIERNTFVAGPLTTVALQINANQAGRPHGPARVSGNVVDMTGAAAGADTVRGGDGLAWAANAWTRLPPAQARGAGDVVGPLGLARPDAALANDFPNAGLTLALDNYRPTPGSRLLDEEGAAFGALEPLPAEPARDDEEPPAPDWDALRAMVAEATTRLAAAGANVAEARRVAATTAAAWALAVEQLDAAQGQQAAAADSLASLLAALNEEAATA